MYFLYILECKNGSYYTGITTDPERRWTEHVAGKAAKYTRAFPPQKVVVLWEVGESRALAQQLEARIKSLPRPEKIRLISDPQIINKIDKLSAFTKVNTFTAMKQGTL